MLKLINPTPRLNIPLVASAKALWPVAPFPIDPSTPKTLLMTIERVEQYHLYLFQISLFVAWIGEGVLWSALVTQRASAPHRLLPVYRTSCHSSHLRSKAFIYPYLHGLLGQAELGALIYCHVGLGSYSRLLVRMLEI